MNAQPYTQAATSSGATLLRHGGTARSKRVIRGWESCDGSCRNLLPPFFFSQVHMKSCLRKQRSNRWLM
ncbi:hypothetical protein D5F51_20450 [Yersinia hibernica]|uniref:Uncharacterized protein n=1 Tax=Yersinia hibernica TaxID=2339259 RepID=A0ABX5R7M1_9GAMM|nr:hypothetical protein D5F51_20450 [Yersinia hibernica]